MPQWLTTFALVMAGAVPSLLWLFYYLHKDSHPEPRSALVRVFLMGIIIAPLAVGAQWAFVKVFSIATTPYFYFWAALVEEAVKLLAVWFIILNSEEFDEPVDAMVYMITASLGFAAIENILFLDKSFAINGLAYTGQLLLLRAVGATLLHALAGAITGYTLALAWFHYHHLKKLLLGGLLLASSFHFAFNLLIISSQDSGAHYLYAMALLASMAMLIQILFKKVQERSTLLALVTSDSRAKIAT